MPNDWPDYELLDFGNGRKLERFGLWILDRPCPVADAVKPQTDHWREVTGRFEDDQAGGSMWTPPIESWNERQIGFPVRLSEKSRFQLQLAPLPSGQIGVFFEQFANWQWIARQVGRFDKT